MPVDDGSYPEIPPETPTSLWSSADVARIAIENASIGMAVLDPNTGVFLEVNQAFCDFLGRARETLRGMSWRSLTHPDDLPADHARVQRVRGGEIDAFTSRKRYLLPDGDVVWGDLSVVGVRDEHGDLTVIIAQVVDATEAVEARDALATSEQRYRLLAENAADFLMETDTEGIVRWVSPAVEGVLGWSPEDLVGDLPLQVVCQDVENKFFENQALLNAGQMAEDRVKVVGRDGTCRWVEIVARPVLDSRGVVMSQLSAWRDITAQVEAEERLQASEEHFRLLAENASDLVFLGRPDWSLAWISPSVTRMLGWEPDELVDSDVVRDLPHPDDFYNIPVPIGDDLGQAIAYEARFRRKDGSYRWMSVTARTLLDDEGEITGIAGSARDVDAEVAARQELELTSSRLQATLNSMIDPLVVLQAVRDQDGRIVDFLHVEANDAAGRHTHRPREELVGTLMSQVVPGQEEAGLYDMYRNVIETGEPWLVSAVPYEDEMQEGALRLFDMSGVKVGDAACLTFRDVTEREKAAAALASSEARFRLLAVNASDIVLEHRKEIVWVSNALTDALGWEPEQWVGHRLSEFIHPDDWDQLDFTPGAFGDKDSVKGNTFRVANADGEYRWMSSRATAIRDEEGNVGGGVVGLRDVHDEVLTTQRLAASEHLFRTAVSSAPVGVVLTDRDGRPSLTNPALSAITQRDHRWLRAHRLRDVLHPEELERIDKVREQFLDGSRSMFADVVRLVRADGSTAWTKVAAVRLEETENDSAFMLLQVEDVTAEREAQEELAFQAFHDSLTGLRNRAWIIQTLAQDIEDAKALRQHVGVLFIDLDNFKVINDSLGHMAGDQVLTEIGNRLQACLHSRERLGRFGGDEFVVIVPEVDDVLEVERTAERIDAAIRQDLEIHGHRIVPTGSIGIAISDGASSAEGLLRDTDAALFRAKSVGRGRWHFFDQEMHEHAIDRLTLESEIRRGLDAGEFFAVYQPIVRLRDRRVTGYEALVRWQHPTRGLVSPADFLPVAEDSGLVVPLGQQVLEHVCATLRARHDLGGPISVNVSAVQLASRDWARGLLATLEEYGVKPEQIVVEVTETAVLSQLDSTGEDLFKLRDLGVGVHVDDFGTGFSSISLLRDLPVTGLKLDRSFVQRLTSDDSQANALSAGVVGLAHGLHLRGIAEGVETEAQWATLLAQGWEYGQGYLFGRPGSLPT